MSFDHLTRLKLRYQINNIIIYFLTKDFFFNDISKFSPHRTTLKERQHNDLLNTLRNKVFVMLPKFGKRTIVYF